MSANHKEARVFVAFAPAVVAGMRASSGFRGLDWPSLRVLQLLAIQDCLTGEALARHMCLAPSTVSKLCEKLREGGHLTESSCGEPPNTCPRPRPTGMPCGKHKFQKLTETGREAAVEWERPFIQELLKTPPGKWVSLGPNFARAHERLSAQRARRRARRARSARPPG